MQEKIKPQGEIVGCRVVAGQHNATQELGIAVQLTILDGQGKYLDAWRAIRPEHARELISALHGALAGPSPPPEGATKH